MPRPGDMVAGLLLEERIGAGGMGVVFRAYDASVDRVVAVKVVSPQIASDPGFRIRLLQEAAAAERVRHPNVVRVHEVGTTPDDVTYVVMHHVAGPNLARLVERDGPLPPRMAGRIIGQVAGALDAVHRAGLLHRDVKPGNILWEPESGTAYLADFGLAAALGASGRTGAGGFTPGYAAPEQVHGGELSPATDVYGLACTLFHCLTGRPPITRDQVEAREAGLAGNAPRLAQIAPHLPRGLDELLARALMPDPARRFGGAGEFAANVRALRRDVVFVAEGPCPDGGALARGLVEGGWDAGVVDTADPAVVAACLGVARTAAVVVTRDSVPAEGALATVVRDAVAADPLLRVVVVLAEGAPRPNGEELGALRGFGWFDVRDRAPDERVAAFRATAERARPGPPVVIDAPCPYPGLTGFGREHSRFFFGRDRELARARELLASQRFVALVGASGSGKSSLLRAGLLASVAPGGAVVVTPGDAPLDRLGEALRGGRRTFVAIDQFEELFTAGGSPETRKAFVERLFAFRDDVPDARIAIAVRADFLGMCASFPALRDAISRSQLLLGPMGPEELHRALTEPARAAGLQLAPGLVERVTEEAGDLTGALPLVSDLMRQVWERRQQDTLTIEALVHVGGVRGALGRRADAAYSELSAADRRSAREVLLRLVTPGEGTADSRRRATLPELLAGAEHDGARRVVDTLVAHRLLTVDRPDPAGEPVVEIVHEALITGWPRLREWVDGRRDELVRRSRLTVSAERWAESGEDAAHLLRGSALAIARELDFTSLPDSARRLVEESGAAADRERLAERRRFRRTVTGLSIGIAVTSLLAVVALVQFVRIQERDRQSRAELLVEKSVSERARDPEMSLRFAREAFSLVANRAVRGNLRAALAQVLPTQLLDFSAPATGIGAAPLARGAVVSSIEGLFLEGPDGRREQLATGPFLDSVIHLPDGRLLALRLDGRGGFTVSPSGAASPFAAPWAEPVVPVIAARASPEGGWIGVLLGGNRACAIRASLDRVRCQAHEIPDARRIAVADDGALLVVGRDRAWSPPWGRAVRIAASPTDAAAIPGEDGCFLVASATTGSVSAHCDASGASSNWRVARSGETLSRIAAWTSGAPGGAAGSRLLAVGVKRPDGSPLIRLFSIPEGDARPRLEAAAAIRAKSASVWNLSFDPESDRLVAATTGQTLATWDPASLVPSRTDIAIPVELQDPELFHFRRGPGGELGVGGIRTFSLDGAPEPPTRSSGSPPTGREVAAERAPRSAAQVSLRDDASGRVRLWVLRGGRWEERELPGIGPSDVSKVAIGDGGDVAIALPDGRIVFSAPGAEAVVLGSPLAGGLPGLDLHVAPTGGWVAGVDPVRAQVRWWHGRRSAVLEGDGRELDDLTFLPDGRSAAILAGGEVLLAPVGATVGRTVALTGNADQGAIGVDERTGLVLVRRTRSFSLVDPVLASEVVNVPVDPGDEPTTPIDVAAAADGTGFVSLLLAGAPADLVVEHRPCGCLTTLG